MKGICKILPVLTAALLAGCEGIPMKMGGSSTAASGSAGGANSAGANSTLPHCVESLGTLAIEEDQTAPWYQSITRDYRLDSTVPLLRLMAQQSNCFVVVERGRALNNMMTERALQESGELRRGSKMGKGQMVAADFTMTPTITLSHPNAGGMGAALAGASPGLALVGALAGNLKKEEAGTTLTLTENRSGVQVAAAEGSASKLDFAGMGTMFGGTAGGGLGAYSNTPQGKVIAAAFVDSFNKLVTAVQNYKAQSVKGGLGKGGRLKISD